ncbi:CPBP family intramembrane glutamic endopeptidase [Streptomyces nojiriensis]|uniref:CPBP family intramembrane glutamic endopeptidase n=1 Tax=Streptomyces nojiriensis TaxID=66374 RepID=UPI0035E17554
MSRIADLHPGRLAGSAPPPLFTARTIGVPLGLACTGAASAALGAPALAVALVATATVCAMHILAPWVRTQSRRTGGAIADALYLAPYVLFFLPYVLWALAVPPAWGWHAWGAVAALLCGLAFQGVDAKSWRTLFTPDIMRLMPATRPLSAALESYQLMASAFCQELFYRGVLFVVLVPEIGAWPTVVVTSLLFTLEHFGNRWGTTAHAKGYYLRITLFAGALGALAAVTGSWLVALLGHLVFNLVPAVQLSARAVLTRASFREEIA